jgi:hypothetical protein
VVAWGVSDKSKQKRAQRRKKAQQEFDANFHEFAVSINDRVNALPSDPDHLDSLADKMAKWKLHAMDVGATTEFIMYNMWRMVHGKDPLPARGTVRRPLRPFRVRRRG